VILREGKNREVRRLWESQGTKVSRLIRVRYANISLPRALHLGRHEELSLEQVNSLRRDVGMSPYELQPPKMRHQIARRRNNINVKKVTKKRVTRKPTR
jgi:23S rRNA pseudouridine2605 synthase